MNTFKLIGIVIGLGLLGSFAGLLFLFVPTETGIIALFVWLIAQNILSSRIFKRMIFEKLKEKPVDFLDYDPDEDDEIEEGDE